MTYRVTISSLPQLDVTALNSKSFFSIDQLYKLSFSSIKRNLSPVMPTSPIHVPSTLNPLMPFAAATIGNVSSTNGLCKLDQNVVSTANYDSDEQSPLVITKDSSPHHLAQWLAFHRLSAYVNVFLSFSGSDLLRFNLICLFKIRWIN